VSREELLTPCGATTHGNIERRTVDIHIAKLRRKISRTRKSRASLITSAVRATACVGTELARPAVGANASTTRTALAVRRFFLALAVPAALLVARRMAS